MTERAEQPRNTWSKIQCGWAWRLQLKVTCNSCSEASDQYKIQSNIKRGILQWLEDGAGSSHTWWEGVASKGEAEPWQETPGSWEMMIWDPARVSIQHHGRGSIVLQSWLGESPKPLVHRTQVLVGAGQFGYCSKV